MAHECEAANSKEAEKPLAQAKSCTGTEPVPIQNAFRSRDCCKQTKYLVLAANLVCELTHTQKCIRWFMMNVTT